MDSEQVFFIEQIATPTGAMLLLTDAQDNLVALDWRDNEHRLQAFLQRDYRMPPRLQPRTNPSAARHAIESYFAGDVAAPRALPVKTAGTAFQREVWRALREIPPGEVVSYGRLAARIGRPQAMRAVGAANGANPINIVVPCHRVIGANAALTGYGGGLPRKAWLLKHESRQNEMIC